MSEKIEYRGPDGHLVGVGHLMDDRRPTQRSSRSHLDPDGTEGQRHLQVRCGKRVLLAAFGSEPLTLLGTFTPDHLLLQGETVIAPRPDLELARLKAGQDPRSNPIVIADAARPLRTEARAARRIGKEKSCPVERVAAN